MAFLPFPSRSAAKGAVEVGLDRGEAVQELACVGHRRPAPGSLHDEERPEGRGEREAAHQCRLVRQRPEPGRAVHGPEGRDQPGGRRGQSREEEEERHAPELHPSEP